MRNFILLLFMAVAFGVSSQQKAVSDCDYWVGRGQHELREHSEIKSFEYFKKALETDSACVLAYYNVGSLLTAWGVERDDRQMMEEGLSYYKRAVALNSSLSDYNYAYYYYAKANSYSDKPADIDHCLRYYKISTLLDSTYAQFYTNWAVTLMKKAKREKNFKRYKDEIVTLLERSYRLSDRAAAYHLARLYSLVNDKYRAFIWLDRLMREEYMIPFPNLTRRRFDREVDFAAIRKDAAYRHFIKKYFQGR